MQRLSRRMERSLRDLGEMFKWLVFEFYTTAKKSEELGPDGTTPIDIDWDAGCMVPDLLDQYPEYAGPENRYRRARIWCKQFRFRITPNSMHNMTQTYRKQMYLLLMKAGFPIDWWTIAEALDMVELAGIEQKMPGELSGGMRKRVGLARAIIHRPAVVLYDEPTTGLDPIAAARIDQLIRRVWGHLKVTSIAVTHDMKSARTISDRILMLHEGEIYASGPTADILSSSDPVLNHFVNGIAA
jgi:translation initiation factor RLI1